MPDDRTLPQHEDLSPRGGILSRERLNALLASPHLTTEQAVAAVNELYRENHVTFPHVVIAKVMVSRDLSGPRDFEHRSYYGPFGNRSEAETWAQRRFAGNESVAWEVEKILTPNMDAHERDRLRRIVEDQ